MPLFTHHSCFAKYDAYLQNLGSHYSGYVGYEDMLKYSLHKEQHCAAGRQKQNHTKARLCNRLTQTSRWVLFNRYWQQLNSLVLFGRSLLFLLFHPPILARHQGIIPDPLIACQISFSLLWSKSPPPPFLKPLNYTLHAWKQNGYFPLYLFCLHVF